jgi:integrase
MLICLTNQENAVDAGKETMRRRRFQHGCVRKVEYGSRKVKVWIGKYYENGESRTRVLGHVAQMNEGEAWAELQRKYLNPINEGVGQRQNLPSNFKEYVKRVFVPQRRENWKEDSTQKTTLERFECYLFPAFESSELRDLTRDKLQQFLHERARSGFSKSVVDHLKWDLNAIFKMAGEDGIVKGNPAGSLVTPKTAKRAEKRTMTKEEYNSGLAVLDVRERLIYRLAGLVGMGPAEILALRWGRIQRSTVEIVERVYRGSLGDPKTDRSRREAAIPPELAADIEAWRTLCVDVSDNALVFPSERGTLLSRDNFLRRNIQKKLATVGLGWVNFQVLRRTQASLGHDQGVDPKVAADQRGHTIGVAIDTYNKTANDRRLEEVTKLENALKTSEKIPGVAAAASEGQ